MKQLVLSLLLLFIAVPAGAVPADLTQIEGLSERPMAVPASAPPQETPDALQLPPTDEIPDSICTSRGDIQMDQEGITFPEIQCDLQDFPDIRITLPDLSF